MDYPDHHHPAPDQPSRQLQNHNPSTGTLSQPATEVVAAEIPFLERARAALAVPAARRQPVPSRKPPARELVTQLQPEIAALRAGTASACNGKPMSWREIANRLAAMAELSEDSLRKAWIVRTGERRRTPRQTQRVAPTSTSGKSGLTKTPRADTPAAAAKVVDPSRPAFGPLFDV